MNQLKKLQQIIKVVEEFRKLDSELQAQAQHVFLDICTHADTTVTDVGKRVGISTASASRNIQLLGNKTRKGNPGLKLVTLVEDPIDARSKRVNLTPYGKLIAKSLTDILDS